MVSRRGGDRLAVRLSEGVLDAMVPAVGVRSAPGPTCGPPAAEWAEAADLRSRTTGVV